MSRSGTLAADQGGAAHWLESICMPEEGVIMHKHRAQTATTTAYTGPVARKLADGTFAPEPRAHGGVRYTERCACGAERAINASGGYMECGQWTVAE